MDMPTPPTPSTKRPRLRTTSLLEEAKFQPARWPLLVSVFYQHILQLDLPSVPGWHGGARVAQSIRHLDEEFRELKDAAETHDMPGLIDGVIDFIYLGIGLLLELGVDPTPFFEEVHVSNMDKVYDGEDPKGCAKPPGWQAPRIAELLEASGYYDNASS